MRLRSTLRLFACWTLLCASSLLCAASLRPLITAVSVDQASPNDTYEVIGANFRDVPELFCILGKLRNRAVYLSPRRLRCTVPHSSKEGRLRLSIMNGDTRVYGEPDLFVNVVKARTASNTTAAWTGDVGSAEADVHATSPLHLARWHPASGGVGTIVSVFVRDGELGDEAQCRFCAEAVKLERVDATHGRCRAPSLRTMITDRSSTKCALRVSNDGVAWSRRDASFVYALSSAADDHAGDRVNADADESASGARRSTQTPPLVTSFSPYRGRPGTQVTVRGDAFRSDAADLSCRFDKTVVAAGYANEREIVCTAPRHVNGEFSFAVSNDGIAWTRCGHFRFTDSLGAPQLSSISPSSGYAGTLLKVFGANFEDTELLACRFNRSARYMVPALYVTSSSVTCVTPTVNAGRVTVEVSSNREDWTPLQSPPITFTFVSDSLDADGDDDDEDGEAAENSDAHGDDEQQPHYEALPDDDAASAASNGVRLPLVRSLLPAHGRSGTTVEVSGDWFSDSASLRCRFGATSVRARVLSRRAILCTAPLRDFPGPVFVEVSVDGKSYTQDRVSFHYENGVVLPLVYAIDPPSGAAGTPVIVYGNNILDSARLRCRFGSVVVVGTAVQVGKRGAATSSGDESTIGAVQCEAPLSIGGGTKVNVELSNDGVQFSESNYAFVYSDVGAMVYSAYPSRTVSFQRVRVLGAGFEPTRRGVRCRFGETPSTAAIGLGQYRSKHRVDCMVPPQALSGDTRVFVSIDGGDTFTNDGAPVQVVGAAAANLLSVEPAAVYAGDIVTMRSLLVDARADLHAGQSLPRCRCRFDSTSMPSTSCTVLRLATADDVRDAMRLFSGTIGDELGGEISTAPAVIYVARVQCASPSVSNVIVDANEHRSKLQYWREKSVRMASKVVAEPVEDEQSDGGGAEDMDSLRRAVEEEAFVARARHFDNGNTRVGSQYAEERLLAFMSRKSRQKEKTARRQKRDSDAVEVRLETWRSVVAASSVHEQHVLIFDDDDDTVVLPKERRRKRVMSIVSSAQDDDDELIFIGGDATHVKQTTARVSVSFDGGEHWSPQARLHTIRIDALDDATNASVWSWIASNLSAFAALCLVKALVAYVWLRRTPKFRQLMHRLRTLSGRWWHEKTRKSL